LIQLKLNKLHFGATALGGFPDLKQVACIDGVFLPVKNPQNPIHFVEVQFQPDEELYSRLFSEILLYLHQDKPANPWKGVIIYPNRSVDEGNIKNYAEFFTSGRVSRIYLDELVEMPSLPVGIATMKLIIEDENTAVTNASQLIARINQEKYTKTRKKQLLHILETILVYKFPQMNRGEIEAMFTLSDLKQTKVYQEAKQEGREEGLAEGREEGREETKFDIIPRLSALGLTVEQIALAVDLKVEQVKQFLKRHKNQGNAPDAK